MSGIPRLASPVTAAGRSTPWLDSTQVGGAGRPARGASVAALPPFCMQTALLLGLGGGGRVLTTIRGPDRSLNLWYV
jgi:hypothetical protein